LDLGEISSTCIAKDFIRTKTNWLPEYISKHKKRKKSNRKPISTKLRAKVMKRDNFTCQHCGKTVEDGVKLEIDHIIPVSLGGTNKMDNLQVLCMECNRGKSNDFCG
jgi:5-methylcytosine-specific restriction endonuclease McrA